MHDVVIIGGGPAGLSAALVLGRSRKRVAMLDGGGVPIRNYEARGIFGFVTRDGTPIPEFRRIAHEQLKAYPTVSIHLDTAVTAVERAGKHFRVLAGRSELETRRVLLCTGIIDEPLAVENYRELWGTSVIECPYCHGYELRDRRFAYLAPSPDDVDWAVVLRSWSTDITVLTGGAFELHPATRALLARANISIHEGRIATLRAERGALAGIDFVGGGSLACEALFVRPRQHQPAVVAALGLASDPAGFVKVDGEHHTSMPGIHAAGDLVTHYHGAMAASASGSVAAHCINRELTLAAIGEGEHAR